MKDWETLKSELLQNEDVAKEYKKMAPRYAIIAQLVQARARKGITQKELAQKLGTKQSAIARLESGNTNPSISFLEKIASVMGYKLTIQIS